MIFIELEPFYVLPIVLDIMQDFEDFIFGIYLLHQEMVFIISCNAIILEF